MRRREWDFVKGDILLEYEGELHTEDLSGDATYIYEFRHKGNIFFCMFNCDQPSHTSKLPSDRPSEQ